MSGESRMFGVQHAIALVLSMLRGRASRRRGMLVLASVGVGMVWLGGFLIEGWLEDRPIVFLGYWALVLWIVIVLVVLSVYDMLQVRRSILMEEGGESTKTRVDEE